MEILIALVVTMVVVGTLAQATRAARFLHSREVRHAERSSAGLRVVEEIVRELGRAGLGLGDDVAPVLAAAEGSSPARDRITIRSSPDGAMGTLLGDAAPGVDTVRVAGAALFHAGDRVLLTDTRGPPVLARVTAADGHSLTLRDLTTAAGRPRRTVMAAHAGRVRRIREVSYFPVPSADGQPPTLARRIDEGAPTTLVHGLARLRFAYQDDAGSLLAPNRLPRGGPRFVTVELALHPEREVPPLRAAATLDPQSGSVAFDEQRVRLRLRRLLFPVPGAVDVTSLPWAENGLVLFQNEDGGSRILSFILERVPHDARVETAIALPEVPHPLALLPDEPHSTCHGCVWIAAEGEGGLELWRLLPDAFGGISLASPLERVLVVDEVRAVAGVVKGEVEGTFVVAERRSPALLRVGPGPSPRTPAVERIAPLSGRPAALARGRDGSLWTLLERDRATDPGTRLVSFPIDEEGRPGSPRTAAELPGHPRGLAVDPVQGWLYALVIDLGDSILYELSPDALRPRPKPPVEVLRLSRWRDEVSQDPNLLHRADRSLSSGEQTDTGREDEEDNAEGGTGGGMRFLPQQLRAVAFDGRGSLFLAGEMSPMILEFTLGRPWVARHRAGLAAAPVQEAGGGGARLRLLGWAQPSLSP